MVKKNYTAIIQARCSSTRLPNKIFRKLGNNALIEVLLDRLSMSLFLDDIVIATSTNKSDDEIEIFCLEKNLKYFRGDLDDVLSRFYFCASEMNLDNIVRVTADDPFKDPKVIDHAIRLFDENKYDYVSNTLKPTFPEGIDVEVFSFDALEKAYESSKLNSERLHVTPYIWKNPNLFSVHNFTNEIDYSNIRLTVDYEEDIIYLNKIYSHINSVDCSFTDIINIIDKYSIINDKKTVRNEGYKRDEENEN